jgi:hypothetical protein
MKRGQRREQALACRCQRKQHLAPIRTAACAAHEVASLELVDQRDRRVVTNHEPLGDRPDSRPCVERKSAQRQEQLMLLRLDACGARGLLAERQERTDLEAKRRERSIVRVGEACHLTRLALFGERTSLQTVRSRADPHARARILSRRMRCYGSIGQLSRVNRAARVCAAISGTRRRNHQTSKAVASSPVAAILRAMSSLASANCSRTKPS